jgi:hypothetical protein
MRRNNMEYYHTFSAKSCEEITKYLNHWLDIGGTIDNVVSFIKEDDLITVVFFGIEPEEY